MNEFEAIEKELSRYAATGLPPSLRTDVLQAIQNQREAQTKAVLLSPLTMGNSRLTTLERAAPLASACLLALSLLIFSLTYQSAGAVYKGHALSMTQANAPEANSRSHTIQSLPTVSPIDFFVQHFAVLQRLNSELFSGTPKKIPSTGGDLQPFGALRARLGIRVLQLASFTPSRRKTGFAT